LVYGYDIHPEFVSIAKKRLVLLAAQRTQQSAKGLDTSIFFHDIKSRDFLQDTPELRGDFHIIANPPFHAQNAPDNFRFSSGKTNSAALILHKCIEIIPTNCRIAAILPDVIRSGSRYETLLQDVRSKLAYSKISVEGKFSKDVDIDIFIISGRKRSVQKPYQKSQDVINGTIQDNFKVSVGAVVPHRHVEEGKRFPYLTAKDIKLNANTSSSSNTLRFTGTVFEPLFIALKRTSSPSDRNRICASIVEGQEPYAVENHVLVLKPKDNSIKSCLSLLFHLKSDSCKDWINQRIRCRHLTVASVKNIPSKFPHEHRPSGPRKRSRR
ncbi:MAG: hypothetical protein KBF76_17475, partial [Verrucomicrobiales bacterium]|nr:hypothetical protein [Verrucomicrobiales bacterium]